MIFKKVLLECATSRMFQFTPPVRTIDLRGIEQGQTDPRDHPTVSKGNIRSQTNHSVLAQEMHQV